MVTKRPFKKYLTLNINEGAAVQDWSSRISEKTGITEKTHRGAQKLDWMSVLCENKQMIERRVAMTHARSTNEDFNPQAAPTYGNGYAGQGPGFLGGEGPTLFPSDPGTGVGANQGAWFDPAYKFGSGDVPTPKLGIQMRVAAYTIGLDLLPVIPMEMSSAIFTFLDSVYAGGKIDDKNNIPRYIAISGGTIGTANFNYATLTTGTEIALCQGTASALADGLGVKGIYVKKGRYGAEIIMLPKSFVTVTASSGAVAAVTAVQSISDVLTAGSFHTIAVVKGDGTIDTTKVVALTAAAKANRVSAIDEGINAAANSDGITDAPMSREKGEKGNMSTITLRRFSTSVEAKEFSIMAQTTRHDEHDLATMGIDSNAQLYKAAENQISQSINNDILKNLFRLGVTSHAKLKAAQGINLNLFVGPASTATKAFTDFGFKEFVDITGTDRKSEFGNIKNCETNSSAENSYTRQRRIASKMLASSNIIATVGRYGRGDFSVVNAHVASALQDNKNFTECPAENTISNDGVNLYFIGNLRGLDIYVDPNMDYYDTRILVGRRGDETSPGLKFMPYDLASSIETRSETTFSNVIAVFSRYALVAAGFLPESQYLTFCIANDFGDWV